MRGKRPPPTDSLDTSVELLRRARGGDADARQRLLERYVPAFRRWARGRLPQYARDGIDTEDLVQDVLVKTIEHLRDFSPNGDGALQAYMRKALSNRIRDELRKVRRHPQPVTVDSRQPDGRASPSQEAAADEALERYEAAFERLAAKDRHAIVARMELGQSWEQVAAALNRPSPDAARMAVGRALRRLAEEMARER